jgi:acetyl-CoA synthetase
LYRPDVASIKTGRTKHHRLESQEDNLMSEAVDTKLQEVAARIRELREISGMSVAEAAEKTEVSEAQYLLYEDGKEDLPFTFIHNCTRAFGVELSAITECHSTKL